MKVAVRGITISGRVVRCQRVSIFERHRLRSTGSRYDIQWVSSSGKLFSYVYTVAVMGKCCEACGVGEFGFRLGFSTLLGDGVSEASTAVNGQSIR